MRVPPLKSAAQKAVICGSLLALSGIALLGFEAPDGGQNSSTGGVETEQSRDIAAANPAPFQPLMIDTAPDSDAVAKAEATMTDETESDTRADFGLSDIDLPTFMAEAEAFFDYVDNCSNCEFQQEEGAPLEEHQQALLDAAADMMRFVEAEHELVISNPSHVQQRPVQARQNLDDIFSFNLTERVTQNAN